MNINKKVGIALILAGILFISLGLAKSTNVLSVVNVLQNGDFESGVAPWDLRVAGAGNLGTFAVVAPGHSGTSAGRLVCSAFPDTEGDISIRYWFETVQVGETYTISFYYTSTAEFMAYFFYDDASWNMLYVAELHCAPTSTWTLGTLQAGPIPSGGVNVWLSFSLYSTGILNIDDVVFGYEEAQPTPTPTPTPTPEPQTWRAIAYAHVAGAGSVSVVGWQVLGLDETLTVEAYPAANYEFAYWAYGQEGQQSVKLYDNPVTVGPETEGTTWSLQAVFTSTLPTPTPTPPVEVNWLQPETLFGIICSALGAVLYSVKPK